MPFRAKSAMAEILVSVLCDCRPPLVTGGRFHWAAMENLRPRQEISIANCGRRGRLVVAPANNKGYNQSWVAAPRQPHEAKRDADAGSAGTSRRAVLRPTHASGSKQACNQSLVSCLTTGVQSTVFPLYFACINREPQSGARASSRHRQRGARLLNLRLLGDLGTAPAVLPAMATPP